MENNIIQTIKQNWFFAAMFTTIGAIGIATPIMIHAEKNSDAQVSEENAYRQVLVDIKDKYGDDQRLESLIKNTHQASRICIDIVENDKRFSHRLDDCTDIRQSFLQPIADGDIKLSLSDELPAFSVVQVFKDSVILHANLPQSTQSLALRKTFEYMAGQKQDGLPYGNGETFTIAEGEVSYYKGRRRAPHILIPSS